MNTFMPAAPGSISSSQVARVGVGRPDIKGVLAPHAARRALQLVGERIGSVGIGLGVRHFKDAGDAAKHGGAAARLKVFLLLQPRLAEMNLRVAPIGRASGRERVGQYV